MPTMRIPTPLRAYTGGQRELELQGHTVGTVLENLEEQFPALKPHIFTEQGALRPFVNIFLGEENINDLQGAETPLKDDDRLLIIPSIAGGR